MCSGNAGGTGSGEVLASLQGSMLQQEFRCNHAQLHHDYHVIRKHIRQQRSSSRTTSDGRWNMCFNPEMSSKVSGASATPPMSHLELLSEDVHEADFLWGVAIVVSRSFGGRGHGGGGGGGGTRGFDADGEGETGGAFAQLSCVVPIADLLNHAPCDLANTQNQVSVRANIFVHFERLINAVYARH